MDVHHIQVLIEAKGMPDVYMKLTVCKIGKIEEESSIFLTNKYVKSSFIRFSYIKL